jgi:hypothetical protein
MNIILSNFKGCKNILYLGIIVIDLYEEEILLKYNVNYIKIYEINKLNNI